MTSPTGSGDPTPRDATPGLLPCPEPLWSAYDLAMLDLDGVVYVGPDPVPGAPKHIAAARGAGMRIAYVTNNAARPPSAVAVHLGRLGVPAAPHDVVTSAQAAAGLVAQRVPAGSRVFAVGGAGVFAALAERGLVATQDVADEPVAVVSGYHPELTWRIVAHGAILVARGLPWVATNTDGSLPTPHGRGPGNGVLVGAVAEFSGRDPVVAGKPEPPLFHETLERVGGRRALVVGDRLDTDIEGARRAGYDSLLVMTGVTDLPALVAAEPTQRPTYLAATLAGLGRPHPRADAGDGEASCGGWTVRVSDGALDVTGEGDEDDWWRSVAAAAWVHLDTTGTVASTERLSPPGSVGGPAGTPDRRPSPTDGGPGDR